MTTIFVTGVPGSGKTTVIQETLKLCPDLIIMGYGEMMAEEAFRDNIDRDTLRKLPFLEQQQIGLKVAHKIAQLSQGVTIVDLHAYIKTPFGFCPGITEAILKILQPYAVTFIESSPSVIYNRRQLDNSRRRDVESEEQIAYHQQICRSLLATCSIMSGALYVPIHNNDEPQKAGAQLATLIQSCMSKSLQSSHAF